MTDQKREPIPDTPGDMVERSRRAQLFKAADAAYERLQAKTDPDLEAWDNALPDGISG